MLIDTSDGVGKLIVLLGLGKAVELPKAEDPKPIPSNLTAWQKLIASVKASDMTESMKVACIAQAIIESGRGTSRVTADCCNFWGIKMRPELEGMAVGRIVKVTSEVEGMAVFAAFESTDIAVKGWLKFLSRSYYKGWEAYKNDSEAFLKHIGESWCPVDGYAEKVIKCIPEAKNLLGVTVATKGKLIALDSGHSISEPGAHSKLGAKEEVLNIQQANLIKAQLEKYGHTVKLVAGKTNDLDGRGAQAKGCDAFISLHHNSYDGDKDPGTEVFCTTQSSGVCREIARKVCNNICKALGTTNRGVKINNWSVINAAQKTGCPIVMLVESYFVNPYTQEQAEKRSAIAAIAIAEAIKDSL
jgi:N-acetylmuramoyl-L-alanine amidase